MKNKDAEVRHQIHAINAEVTKKEARLLKIEDYSKAIQSMVPMTELAMRFSARADVDDGHDKEALRVILADILTLKEEVAEAYSNLADSIKDLTTKAEKLKEEL